MVLTVTSFSIAKTQRSSIKKRIHFNQRTRKNLQSSWFLRRQQKGRRWRILRWTSRERCQAYQGWSWCKNFNEFPL